jgi:hypothetical protein
MTTDAIHPMRNAIASNLILSAAQLGENNRERTAPKKVIVTSSASNLQLGSGGREKVHSSFATC